MAAKKKVAKKVVKSKAKARAPAKKPAKRPAKKPVSAKPAGSVEVVKLPIIDVTADVKQTVVPAEATKADPQPQLAQPPIEKHEEFQQALAAEPPKRGFWARLFGKK